MLMTESPGASNAKAKRELGWTLRYPTWRRGFVEAYRGARVSADAYGTASNASAVGSRRAA
jgi:hypothetical protein